MDQGNKLRDENKIIGGGTLAAAAAAAIHQQRSSTEPKKIERKIFVIHQLKHPEEVILLRSIYGDSFKLIGVSCSDYTKKHYLTKIKNVAEYNSELLIKRDRDENKPNGQHTSDTFHMSDYFINIPDNNYNESLNNQVDRLFRILFRIYVVPPTKEEFCMFIAWSTSLRSADLSRQVGACIANERGDIISVGANDVPCFGGGTYWPSPQDARDYVLRQDENKKEISRMIDNIAESIADEFGIDVSRCKEILEKTKMNRITEYGRSMHAEMDALMAASRNTISVAGCILYTTTFPCHNCARHIVGSGINEIIFIEPYPKSMAMHLHRDSITESDEKNKVKLRPFIGVSPRMYPHVFSLINKNGVKHERKNKKGDIAETKKQRRHPSQN